MLVILLLQVHPSESQPAGLPDKLKVCHCRDKEADQLCAVRSIRSHPQLEWNGLIEVRHRLQSLRVWYYPTRMYQVPNWGESPPKLPKRAEGPRGCGRPRPRPRSRGLEPPSPFSEWHDSVICWRSPIPIPLMPVKCFSVPP